jgi:hypothetical protein
MKSRAGAEGTAGLVCQLPSSPRASYRHRARVARARTAGAVARELGFGRGMTTRRRHKRSHGLQSWKQAVASHSHSEKRPEACSQPVYRGQAGSKHRLHVEGHVPAAGLVARRRAADCLSSRTEHASGPPSPVVELATAGPIPAVDCSVRINDVHEGRVAFAGFFICWRQLEAIK